MIKLIMTDIDGTLVPEGSTNLNPEYFEVIEKLVNQGIIFVVASGRHYVSIEKVFGPVLDKIWIVSQNGNVITHHGKSHVIKPVPTEWIRDMWEELSKYEKVDSIIDTADATYCPYEGTSMYNLLVDNYKYSTQAVEGWNVPDGNEYSMMTIYHPDSAEEFCKDTIFPKWSSKMNLFPTGRLWVDCVMPGISKGLALETICSKENISLDETIAFGDNMNDIPMIQAAGTGYAVACARDEVKAAADKIVPGFDEDGVLQEIKKLLR